MNIVKGSRVRAKWFNPKPFGSYGIAGMQMKVVGNFVEVVGTIRHFRGDDPVAPTKVEIFVDSDEPSDIPTVRPYGCTCDHEHIRIKPDWVVEIL